MPDTTYSTTLNSTQQLASASPLPMATVNAGQEMEQTDTVPWYRAADDRDAWAISAPDESIVDATSRAFSQHHDHWLHHLPDPANWAQDVDYQFTDLDIPAIELAIIGDALSAYRVPEHWPVDSDANVAQPPPPARAHLGTEAATRSSAFRRSPWTYWDPATRDHAFTSSEVLDARAMTIRQDAGVPSQIPDQSFSNNKLDEKGRDKILEIFMNIRRYKLTVSSLPSLELFNNLIRAFFCQDYKAITSSIHVPTFACHSARPELLLGLAAAAAMTIPSHQVQKMGLVMHEVLRLATMELYEGDNSATRDTQANQAWLIALEIGAWSGIKRKTEIACGFVQPLCVMLRQSGAFNQTPPENSEQVPVHEDDESLRRRWNTWTANESLKRLTIRAFIHDSQVALAFLQPPSMSYAQMSVVLPASAKSWFASDAYKWKECTATIHSRPKRALLTEIFADLTVLEKHSTYTDLHLCCLATIHAIANQVWDLRQQLSLDASQVRGLESRCKGRQRDLYEQLKATRLYCERRAPHHEISFALEYVMMSLHVSVAEIHRFAGKEGEHEARRSTASIRQWNQESDARIAIWHAGQVLRMARRFPPSTLHDFYAVGTYHAALTLWAYSHADLFNSPVHEVCDPNMGSAIDSSSTMIRLDQAEDSDTRTFLLLGHGSPGLSYPSDSHRTTPSPVGSQLNTTELSFRPLTQPASVLNMASEILRSNLRVAKQDLPHLIQNIVGLMHDLVSLGG